MNVWSFVFSFVFTLCKHLLQLLVRKKMGRLQIYTPTEYTCSTFRITTLTLILMFAEKIVCKVIVKTNKIEPYSEVNPLFCWI